MAIETFSDDIGTAGNPVTIDGYTYALVSDNGQPTPGLAVVDPAGNPYLAVSNPLNISLLGNPTHLSIAQPSGSSFDFNSITIDQDVGLLGGVTFVGYRDGTAVATQTAALLASIGNFDVTFSGPQWSGLDEVRIYETGLLSVNVGVGFGIDNVLTTDTTAPGAPTLTSTGAATANPQPILTGTAEIGSTVTISAGPTALGTAVADGTGAYAFTPPAALADGTYTFTATATDADGNASAPSTPAVLTIDATAPAAPSLAAPALTNDSTPDITGSAEAGATVTVFGDGIALGTTVAGGTGAFAFTPAAPLADGSHVLTATATDPAGNVSPVSAGVTTAIDAGTTAAPSLAGPALTNDGTPTVTGTGQAGGTVTLFDGTTPVGSAGVASDGTFSVTPANPLGDGSHSLTATVTDPTGNSSAPSSPVTITVDTIAPAAPSILSPAATGDSTPTVTGTAEAGSTVSLFEGSTVLGTTVAAADGTFSVTLAQPLADGTHVLSAVSTDGAGNISAPSAALALEVDAGTPVVTVDGVQIPANFVDHVVKGTVENVGAVVTVTVQDAGHLLGTTVTDAGGHWSLPFNLDPTPGPTHAYQLAATATGPDGSTATSDVFDFTIDSTPNKPVFGTVSTDTHDVGGAIYALYEGLLDRAPDALGAEHLNGLAQHGMSVGEIAGGLLRSAEAAPDFGRPLDDSAFVQQLYDTVLNRTGDAGEVGYWVKALGSGGSRGDVALGFVLSDEHAAALQPELSQGVFTADPTTAEVARLYHGLLGRSPETGGLQYWDATADHQSLVEVAQGFLDQHEYVSLHPQPMTNAEFVESLYEGALGRTADSGGGSYWTDQLASGHSRAEVAIGITESAEGQQHLQPLIEQGWHLHS